MADDNSKASEKSSKKGASKLLIILIILILLVGGGAAAYFLVLKKEPAQREATQDQPAVQQMPMQRSATAEPGPVIAYPAFLVNLADPGGNRYLRVTMSLELSKDKNFASEVASKEPKIKDIIISVLSSKTYDEINTTQGKIALKQEILRRLNTIMSGGRINDIFITEFVVQ